MPPAMSQTDDAKSQPAAAVIGRWPLGNTGVLSAVAPTGDPHNARVAASRRDCLYAGRKFSSTEKMC